MPVPHPCLSRLVISAFFNCSGALATVPSLNSWRPWSNGAVVRFMRAAHARRSRSPAMSEPRRLSFNGRPLVAAGAWTPTVYGFWVRS